MNKRSNSSMSVVLVSLGLVLPSAALQGFAMKVLWGWFAVPLHAPRVGVWEAIGLATLLRLLTFDYTLKREAKFTDDPWVNLFVQTGMVVLVCAASLGFGAIYHAFM